jgi:triphosphoribosyl-dephospho-CoA synthetase
MPQRAILFQLKQGMILEVHTQAAWWLWATRVAAGQLEEVLQVYDKQLSEASWARTGTATATALGLSS